MRVTGNERRWVPRLQGVKAGAPAALIGCVGSYGRIHLGCELLVKVWDRAERGRETPGIPDRANEGEREGGGDRSTDGSARRRLIAVLGLLFKFVIHTLNVVSFLSFLNLERLVSLLLQILPFVLGISRRRGSKPEQDVVRMRLKFDGSGWIKYGSSLWRHKKWHHCPWMTETTRYRVNNSLLE